MSENPSDEVVTRKKNVKDIANLFNDRRSLPIFPKDHQAKDKELEKYRHSSLASNEDDIKPRERRMIKRKSTQEQNAFIRELNTVLRKQPAVSEDSSENDETEEECDENEEKLIVENNDACQYKNEDESKDGNGKKVEKVDKEIHENEFEIINNEKVENKHVECADENVFEENQEEIIGQKIDNNVNKNIDEKKDENMDENIEVAQEVLADEEVDDGKGVSKMINMIEKKVEAEKQSTNLPDSSSEDEGNNDDATKIECRLLLKNKIHRCTWTGHKSKFEKHFKKDHPYDYSFAKTERIAWNNIKVLTDTTSCRTIFDDVFWSFHRVTRDENNQEMLYYAICCEGERGRCFYEVSFYLRGNPFKKMILMEGIMNVNEDVERIFVCRRCVAVPLQVITMYFNVKDDFIDQIICETQIKKFDESG